MISVTIQVSDFLAACGGSHLLLLRDVPPQAAHPAATKLLVNHRRW